jgi:two-component system chemotaxis sensor kinase CheA
MASSGVTTVARDAPPHQDAPNESSGRGVGLDVVRTTVRRLGGRAEIDTQRGKRTRFLLTLPLTTAIMQTLMVNVSGQVFLVPADIASEAVQLDADDLLEVEGRQMMVLRKELIPFRWFSELMNLPTTERQEAPTGLIVRIGDRRFCVGVDAVADQRESIVKAWTRSLEASEVSREVLCSTTDG